MPSHSVPSDKRDMGACEALTHASLEQPEHLDMIFPGFVHPTSSPSSSSLKSRDPKAVRFLLDTGASHCFVGLELVQKMGWAIRPSSLKSVATAAGRASAILGEVSFHAELDAVRWEVTAHVLSSFLAEAQVILGQEFLKSNNAKMACGTAQCTLQSPSGAQVTLSRLASGGAPRAVPSG